MQSFFPAVRHIVSGLLCVFLLSVQIAEATHTHEGEDLSRFECEICLKAASAEDEMASAAEFLLLARSTSEAYFLVDEVYRNTGTINAQSRSPPIS
tara:strand:+ start:109 stop:396 length:288 start_codon:yes stop_codon:yes gene_type:complete